MLNHISQSCKAAIVVEAALRAPKATAAALCDSFYLGRLLALEIVNADSAPYVSLLSPGSVNSGGA